MKKPCMMTWVIRGKIGPCHLSKTGFIGLAWTHMWGYESQIVGDVPGGRPQKTKALL